MKKLRKFTTFSLMFLLNTTRVFATEAGTASPADEKSIVGKFLILVVGVILVSLVLFISYKLDKNEEESERKEKIISKEKPNKEESFEESRVVEDKNIKEADISVDDISDVDEDLYNAMLEDDTILKEMEETEENIDSKIQEYTPKATEVDEYELEDSEEDEEDDEDLGSFMYEIVDADDLEDDYNTLDDDSDTTIFDSQAVKDVYSYEEENEEVEENEEPEYFDEEKKEVEYDEDDLSDLEEAIHEANTSRFTRKKEAPQEERRPSRVYTHMRKASVKPVEEKPEPVPEKPKRAKRGTKAFEMTEVKERPKRGRKPKTTKKTTAKKTTTKKTTTKKTTTKKASK